MGAIVALSARGVREEHPEALGPLRQLTAKVASLDILSRRLATRGPVISCAAWRSRHCTRSRTGSWASTAPASFFESFYYRKNFDLPGYRWRHLDGDTELLPGVTVLRTDGHTPGHQSLLVELPETGPVILTGDACYWQEHADKERVPGVVWNPTLALHSLKKLKTIARLVRGRIFPGHDPVFWDTVIQAPDAYR